MAEILKDEAEILKEENVPVEERERFYHDRIGSLLLLASLAGGLVVIFVILNIFLYTISVPPPAYFQATEQGQILQEPPLDKPNLASNELLNWTVEAMMAAHTFNFMNYSRVLEDAKDYFTPEGYPEYLTAINNVGVLDRLKKDKLVLVSAAVAAPEILKEGPFANRYLWKVKVPLGFNYRNVVTNVVDNVNITLLILRVPTTQSPNGISILKYEIEYKRQL